MATTFVETIRDETLRIELGDPALSDLAVENLDLSPPALSRAIRLSVIHRRMTTDAVVRMPGPNRLEMHQVALPDAA